MKNVQENIIYYYISKDNRRWMRSS